MIDQQPQGFPYCKCYIHIEVVIFCLSYSVGNQMIS